MLNIDPVILNFAVALGIGLLIGAERERRKGEGPSRSPAGIRTVLLRRWLEPSASPLAANSCLPSQWQA